MASDSELDEFFDAEDSTPLNSFRDEVPVQKTEADDVEAEVKAILELKRKQDERRRKEDQELETRLSTLLRQKEEDQLKKAEQTKKAKQLESRRRKHKELRQRIEDGVLRGGYSSGRISESESDQDQAEDETDSVSLNMGSVASQPSVEKKTRNRSAEIDVNVNGSLPMKESLDKEIHKHIDMKEDNVAVKVIEYVVQDNFVMDAENEPDIVKSTKTRTPPNTLQQHAVPPCTDINQSANTEINLEVGDRIPAVNTPVTVSENSQASTSKPLEMKTVPMVTITSAISGEESKTVNDTVFKDPVAPPRRKKRARDTASIASSEDSVSLLHRNSVSSLPFDFEPRSPGLPSEILTPSSEVDNLTKDLEHSLDLRSVIKSGKKHIKAEDAEIDAVNSDHDSPQQTLESTKKVMTSGDSGASQGTSKTSSLDRTSGVPSKSSSLDRTSSVAGQMTNPDRRSSSVTKSASLERNSSGMIPRKGSMNRPRSNSGRLLTDEEILELVVVKNLDTGETVPLKDAEKALPQCIDPLVLHIMQRTKEYNSDTALDLDDQEDGRSESGKSTSIEHGVRKKASRIKKMIGKRVGKTVNKVKSKADQVLHGDDNTVMEDEVSEDGKRFKFKANHNKKGPYDFGQIHLLQDLGSDHTGAIWAMKFSPCGRLLATGGQDSVLRIWVLKSAYTYFDDMRQKYAEVKVSPAPSQESLNSATSDASSLDLGACVEEEDESRKGPFHKRPFCKYRGHTADLLDVSWSKNYFILSSSMDKTVRLWHISRRECLCTFQHIDFVTAIVFHPRDDRYFLSGSLDGKLRLWNIPDKKVTMWNEVNGSSSLITTANFCHNGKFAVAGTYDGKCIFFSTEQLKYYTQIHVRSTRGKNARGRKITGIEPLPGEDKVLVTSNDSRIRLYDLRDLTLTCKYKGPTNTSSQIRAGFSPKGRFVISGSEDHFIYMWRTQHEFYKFSSARRDRSDYWEAVKAHNAVVTAAVFAPHPAQFRSSEDKDGGPHKEGDMNKDGASSSREKDGAENHGEYIVSADFLGSIKILHVNT